MIAGRDLSRVPKVSVQRLANYLKRTIDGDTKLAFLGVEGELSNVRFNTSGHVNFSVKDREAVLQCFAFASDAATFPELKDGTAVVAYGKVSTYPAKSVYQLTVRHIELAGLGRLFQRYDELKRRLYAEGLFREDRKRSLPQFPFRVALVGSRVGEGTRDFRTQAKLRAPQVTVELFDTPVQGDVAPQIVATIKRACASNPDILVIARGGGSFEDLFVFSDERVVRAVAACTVPVVTAIGHEGDIPLVDLVADRRAATPSTAAQTVLPLRGDLLRTIGHESTNLERALDMRVREARRALELVEYRSPLADPLLVLAASWQRLDSERDALTAASERRLRRFIDRLAIIERSIMVSAPLSLISARRKRLTALNDRSRVVVEDRFRRNRERLRALERSIVAASPASWLAARRERLLGIRERLNRRMPAHILRYHTRIESAANSLLSASVGDLGMRRAAFERFRTSFVDAGNTLIPERLGRLHEMEDRLERRSLRARLAPLTSALYESGGRLERAGLRVVERRIERFRVVEAGLRSNNPEAVLQRGYAIVEVSGGGVLVDPAQAPPGSRLRVRLSRGELTVRVERDGEDGGKQIGLF